MLERVKVLSFTHFLQGPSAVQMLADIGADVVKIEPVTGAFERNWSGFDAYMNGVSVFFMLANRNQRSLSIDLRSEKGKEIIYKLAREADVVVENFRPGVMDRLGFGYEKLKELNPGIVYCSCTGYGSDGPYLHLPGQDMLIQGMSGITSLSGKKDQAPTPVGSAIVDQHAAALAGFGILAALFERTRTGKGQKVESNLLNAALDLQIEPLNYYLNMGPLWERSETGLATRFHQSPYGVYQTADGWIVISNTPIDKLATVLEEESLKFYTVKDQMTKRDDIDAIVARKMRTKTTEQWFAIFKAQEIWHSPVNEYEQVVDDPQVNWNRAFLTFEHPDAGTVKLLNHPVRYETCQTEVRRYPPRIGEHSADILKECGYSDDDIAALFSEGVVHSFDRK